MCCGTRLCCFFMCVVLLVIAIGFLFDFGVFKHGFHKLKDTVNVYDPAAVDAALRGRPFLGYGAPTPY
ncbi:hypothetical protein OROGR_007191 [Orobanche gracilis]